MSFSILDRRERSALAFSTHLNSNQGLADQAFSQATNALADPYSLAGLAVAPFFGKWARVGAVSAAERLLGGSLGALSKAGIQGAGLGLGLGVEALAFESTQRSLRVGLAGADASLLSLSSLKDGFSHSFLNISLLKGAGALGSGNAVLSHFGADAAMVAGNHLAAVAGLMEKPGESLLRQLVAADAMNWQMKAGAALFHAASPSMLGRERVLDLALESGRSSRLPASLEASAALSAMASPLRQNTRVNGPVLDLIEGHALRSAPSEGFMGTMANPADGFEPFMSPDGSYVVWLGSPKAYPGPLAPRLETTWNNALGAVLVANPALDAMGLIVMHGAMKNSWAPDAAGQSPVWRGLGGMMAFTRSIPHARDLNPLLADLGLPAGEGFHFDALTPEHQAWVNFLGAAEKTQGKAMGMTPKWRFIDQALEAIGIDRMTALGGMKSVVLHAPTDAAKGQAVRMMAEVAKILGIYISGGDEGTARGPWTDMFAEVAPLNMAGSKNSHPLIRGRYPSAYTAQGVFQGIKNYFLAAELDPRATPIFFQGVGGVGKNVLEYAMQANYSIAGASDIIASDLAALKQAAAAKGYAGMAVVWDRQAAREALEPTMFAQQEAIAQAEGLLVADGLVEAMKLTQEHAKALGQSGDIPVLSLNATSHQISEERVDAFAPFNTRAVIGGANNMLELDAKGSYLPAAQKAVAGNLFVPNDSAINRMGATIVLAEALGIDESTAQLLARWVGSYASSEYWLAHQRGIPPQVFSDRRAQDAWNRLLASGQALGGRFGAP